jgi:hypothetical protein
MTMSAYVTQDQMSAMADAMHSELAAMDAAREATEEARSKHRNGNRLLVLAVAFMINMIWPTIMLHIFHDVAGTAWTPALSSSADILVTAYALHRRY